MSIEKISERIMGMSDTTWARHANPWSGWTRMTVLPLISVAIWSRVWLGWGAVYLIVAVLIWTWLNPRLFSPPKHNDAWMSKGVLGERVWLARGTTPIPRHHVIVGQSLIIATGLGAIVLMYGLWQLDLGWVCAGLAMTVGGKLWFLDRMCWLLADTASGNQ